MSSMRQVIQQLFAVTTEGLQLHVREPFAAATSAPSTAVTVKNSRPWRRENGYLHTIILIYKLRKLSMLFPTSSSLTKMNLAYRAAISSPWRSRFSRFFSLLIDSYVVL